MPLPALIGGALLSAAAYKGIEEAIAVPRKKKAANTRLRFALQDTFLQDAELRGQAADAELAYSIFGGGDSNAATKAQSDLLAQLDIQKLVETEAADLGRIAQVSTPSAAEVLMALSGRA